MSDRKHKIYGKYAPAPRLTWAALLLLAFAFSVPASIALALIDMFM